MNIFPNVSGDQKQLSLTKGRPPRCASKTRRRVVEALPFLLTVLAVVPTGCGANADLHKLLGEVQRQYNSDPAGAIARLARVETETPHPGVSMLLGKLHFERLAWAKARRSFDLAAQAMPNPEAFFSLGVVAEKLSDQAGAMLQYRKAIELQPNHAEALTNLGILTATTAATGGTTGGIAGLRAGLKLLKQALALAPDDPVAQKHIAMVELQAKELARRKRLVEKDLRGKYAEAVQSPGDGTVCLPPTPVDRIPADELSLRRFYEEYGKPGKPVIITKSPEILSLQWTPDIIAEACGKAHTGVSLRRPIRSGRRAWAGLETSRNITVARFLADVDSRQRGEYLFDLNIQAHCPALLDGFRVPKYFAQDFLQRAPRPRNGGRVYRDFWPSLFVGGAETVCDTHVDAWCSNFYVGLLRGRKRWTLFRRADAPRLYFDHFTSSFGLNLTALVQHDNPVTPGDNADDNADDEGAGLCITADTLARYPLAQGLRPMQADLVPGELLFVPRRTPHYVVSSGDPESIAISANYVDASNVECAIDGLALLGLETPAAAQLAAALKSKRTDKRLDLELDNSLSWTEFKRGHQPPVETRKMKQGG